MISNFKSDMMMKYEMSDLGIMHYFLGIEIVQSVEGIFITQKNYAKAILEKLKMLGCKSVATPLVINEKFQKEDGSCDTDESIYRSLVGSLLYLISCTCKFVVQIHTQANQNSFWSCKENPEIYSKYH